MGIKDLADATSVTRDMTDLLEGTKVEVDWSDGSTASYYELPRRAKELQDLIAFVNMNAQMGEIFRATYRYGKVSHSGKMRDIKKIIFYAKAELKRLEKYETAVPSTN